MEQLAPEGARSGCLLRAFWLFAGPALLIVLAVPLAGHPGGAIGIHLLYFGTLAACAIARVLDRAADAVDPGSPTTAPPPGKRPYLIGLFAAGTALWAAARWLGPEILG
ncbi:MAG: hypothetical protein L0323_06630 [Planctomycetes bacterium]|nr:hypothetical protein [Planctomycetota bacterium]